MKRLILILGGARSGKSRYAEELAATGGASVLYVATAEAWDDEMAARIAAHRSGRPPAWRTLEAPTEVGEAIAAALAEETAQIVLLDCLTLLANNLLSPLPEPLDAAAAEAALAREIDALLAVYTSGTATWIIVSNEVGLGIVPPTPLGRVYRDALGRTHAQLAAAADAVIFMVAGLPLAVKGAASSAN